ncbi:MULTISPECIES: GIN domain-containing protein [Myroides]|uniref:Putative auto-transporter adhesin head GIN domain-containing protein n=1 Tax=Myroides albus TaxID=2562892 RepID=A0A6I3LR63_9FLAO|nr:MULTISPECIES: DUF2807 domain-containing protein [Myroides]MTG98662.1 hypothetical protein [Myroides albus]MVX36445.1 hypothetical protein [Myroides sp. LoEW2-1]UVD81255.1 DUF2807 domain-containing protein [Myroides albus]
MVRIIISFFLFLMSWVMSAQTTKTVDITGSIVALDVSYPINVYVDATKDDNVIKVEAKEDVIEYISVRQVGQKVVVDVDTKSKRRNLGIGTVNVYLSQKSIEKFSVSAVAKVYVSGRMKVNSLTVGVDANGGLQGDFQANSVSLNIDSAGWFKGNISATSIKANIDSAAKVTVSGDVESLTVNVDSAATFDGKDLKAKNVKVEADSMGKALVYPTESLNAYADSMGKVVYYNTPKELKKYTDSMGSVKSK